MRGRRSGAGRGPPARGANSARSHRRNRRSLASTRGQVLAQKSATEAKSRTSWMTMTAPTLALSPLYRALRLSRHGPRHDRRGTSDRAYWLRLGVPSFSSRLRSFTPNRCWTKPGTLSQQLQKLAGYRLTRCLWIVVSGFDGRRLNRFRFERLGTGGSVGFSPPFASEVRPTQLLRAPLLSIGFETFLS